MRRRNAVAGVVTAGILAAMGGIVFIHPLNFNQPANQFYVTTTGSDSANGSLATPWLTVTHAGSTVTAGATVHVASGTYGASTIANSGNSAAHVTYISDTVFGALLAGGSSYGLTITGDYVDVKQFDVTATTAVVGLSPQGDHDSVIGNHVHSVGDTGACQPGGGAIDAFAHSGTYSDQTAVLIQGNLVDHVGQVSCLPTNFIHGIYTTSAGVKIYNNIVAGSSGYGIQCWHACQAPTVSSNTTFNGGQGGIIVGTGDSGAVAVFNNAVMTNNISVNNTGYGLREYSYDAAHMGTSNTWANNNCNANSVGCYLSDYSKNVQTGSVTTVPAFVNYQADGSGDYHLANGSGDIDTGTSTGAPSTDYAGTTRPQGSTYDIGAYER